MSLIMGGAAVVFFSLLAFWRLNPVLFMLASGSSMMLGLQWYDVYVTNTGLSIGLLLIAYSFVCAGFAFRCIFWRNKEINEE